MPEWFPFTGLTGEQPALNPLQTSCHCFFLSAAFAAPFSGSEICFPLPSAVAGVLLRVDELHVRGGPGALPPGPVHTLFKRVMIALAPLLDRWWAGRMNFSSGPGCGRGRGLSFRSDINTAPRADGWIKESSDFQQKKKIQPWALNLL